MADEQLLTKDMLKKQLGALGVEQGMKILVHVALSKVGRLENGPLDLIRALEEIRRFPHDAFPTFSGIVLY